MSKLKMLKPKLPLLDPWKARGLKMAPTPRYRAKQSGRDADARRTIPLNSSQWQKLRAQVLADEPLCRHCKARGIVTPATDVDHISGDPSDNSMTNLAGLCHECHSRKTAADHGKTARYGCGTDGMPLGTRHHWNVAPRAATQGADALTDERSPAVDSPRPPGTHSFNPKSDYQPSGDDRK